MGLDGFALNVGDPTQPYVLDTFNSIFDYTRDKHPNFKLFLSMDCWACGNAFSGPCPLDEYDTILTGFLGHAAWLHGPNGQPFISTYSSGGFHNTNWENFRDRWGNSIYFVPDFDDTEGYNTSATGWWSYWVSLQFIQLDRYLLEKQGDVVDGMFSWETAWPHPTIKSTGDVGVDTVVCNGAQQHQKSYMAR